jgi:hypothetical protein
MLGRTHPEGGAMIRSILAAVVALAFCVSLALAEEVKGKVKQTDPDKFTITVTVDGKDKTYPVDMSAFVITAQGRNFKGGFKALKGGEDVIITTNKKEDKEIVGVIKVATQPKKK